MTIAFPRAQRCAGHLPIPAVARTADRRRFAKATEWEVQSSRAITPARQIGLPATTSQLSWAELMHRVWAIDVLECPRCLGRMRILAAFHPPDAIRAILECLGLPSRAPPIASAAGRSSSHPDEPV